MNFLEKMMPPDDESTTKVLELLAQLYQWAMTEDDPDAVKLFEALRKEGLSEDDKLATVLTAYMALAVWMSMEQNGLELSFNDAVGFCLGSEAIATTITAVADGKDAPLTKEEYLELLTEASKSQANPEEWMREVELEDLIGPTIIEAEDLTQEHVDEYNSAVISSGVN